MGWIVLIPSLAVWRVLTKRLQRGGGGRGSGGRGAGGGKFQKVINVAVMVTAFVAGCGLALTFLANLIVWPLSLVPSPALRIALSAAVILLAGLTMLVDIAKDQTADKAAQWAAFLTPTFLVLLAGGIVGATAGDIQATVVANVGRFFAGLGDS